MTHESELAELDLALKRLEVEKMRAEVDQARLAWWKRPGYIGGLVPIMLAMVGLLTAWANGYFDTQRTQLASEIAALEDERADLTSKVADVQRAIDFGYLQAKLAAFEASYAIGHFEAFSEEAAQAKGYLVLAAQNIDPEMRGPITNLLGILEQQQSIGSITKDAVTQVLSQLDEIEASPWVKALETNPMLSAEGRFTDPDGRVFDLALWDWVDT